MVAFGIPDRPGRECERNGQPVGHADHDVADELAGGEVAFDVGGLVHRGVVPGARCGGGGCSFECGSIGFATGSPRVALEPVVEIVMPALPPCQETRQQIGRDKRNPPALDLADVGLLVVAAEVQAPGVAADDHVAQRHRPEPDPVGEPPRQAAMKLERAAPALDPARPSTEVSRPATRPTSVVGAAQAYRSSAITAAISHRHDWTVAQLVYPRTPIEFRATAPWQSGHRSVINNQSRFLLPTFSLVRWRTFFAPETERMNPRRLFVASCIALVASAFSFVTRGTSCPRWGRPLT